MNDHLSVRIYEHDEPRFTVDCRCPIEFGRDTGGEPLGQAAPIADGGSRLIIASREEVTVSRRHLRIESLADGRARLTVLSTTTGVRMPNGVELPPGEVRDLPLPAMFRVGPKVVKVQAPAANDESAEVDSLPHMTLAPRRSATPVTRFPALNGTNDPTELVRWLQTAQAVLHSAAGSADFFARATQAAKEIVGLDSAHVVLLEGGQWRQHPPDATGPPPSHTVLRRLLSEKRTFWVHPKLLDRSASLAPVHEVVAAPILNAAGEVIGALYGERRGSPARQLTSGPVTKLEAMLVELLAGAVAAGLARMEEEKNAAAARVRYEEFLTPELARQLIAKPELLEGREVEVTVLFADIREYSGVCEKLGAEQSVAWVGDVLGELSECVQAEGGVLVDYIGDELMAMWGAPAEQPDHAARAVRAARAMLARLPALDAKWHGKTCRPLGLGIGMHTGTAHVGNVGTKHKFKYGPLGPTNNLASRVQGATKYLRLPVLMTGATRAKIDHEFATRRLTRVKVVNIDEPLDLVQFTHDPPADWDELRDGYESALADFEAGRTLDAIRRLGPLLAAHPDDGPALLLLTRAVQARQPNAGPFDPVWVLPGK